QELFREEGLFARAAALESVLEDAVHSLKGAPHVKDVRNLGLVAGIELEPRPGALGERAQDVFVRCFDAGLLIRVTGDIIALSPPLIISEAQIAETVDGIAAALRAVD